MNIKYLIMDVDGTLTDGNIYMGNDGEIMKAFNIKDGYGIHDILIPKSIIPVIITGRESRILEKRCSELGIDRLYQGVVDKVKKLTEVTKNLSQAAYIGDDLNDLAAMMLVKSQNGVIGCPKDAAAKVKCIADFVSTKDGGNGAVREFIEWITENQ